MYTNNIDVDKMERESKVVKFKKEATFEVPNNAKIENKANCLFDTDLLIILNIIKKPKRLNRKAML